ncbi:MAG: flagellar assembly protein FliW [Defluviitaleaceae bacterium]|nr:flagellar assembly protein FliW [Defluviitaleaceae bacterium]
MTLNTQLFGTIEINPDDIISFHEGLPGFPLCTRFAVLFQEAHEEAGESGEVFNTICFLQSVEDAELSFVLIDTTSLFPEYRPLALLEYAKDAQSGFDHKNFAVYNILTIHDDMANSTANLKAPIVLDLIDKLGRQVIFKDDESYPIRARIFDAPPKKDGECAC